jgi:uncharacterized protein (DUF488 family)
MVSCDDAGMIHTIGHSNHPIERFLGLLMAHKITALADVRSSPYSRRNPQFNRESLRKSLALHEIRYVFLGEELGARSRDPSCYEDGRVSYARLAASNFFQEGLERLKTGMIEHNIAMMCAEKDPLECHRTILVSRHLAAHNIEVAHILASGQVESHAQALARLSRQLHVPETDMFRTRQQLLDEAYDMQGRRIAYIETDTSTTEVLAVNPHAIR